jgi:hypothetical protein
VWFDCGTIGPVIVEGDSMWELLRSLDDPVYLSFPVGYDHAAVRSRFDQLVDRLDAAFSCSCPAARQPEDFQDSSSHGFVNIPAEATATGGLLIIFVSNFGDLAVVMIEGPGEYTQAEFTELLDPADADRIQAALDGLGYTSIPEEPPWRQPYDGRAGWWRQSFSAENPQTWFDRFFGFP